MSAGKYNLPIEQGSTFNQQFTVKDTDTGLAMDLTGCVIRSQIRETVDATTILATFLPVYTDMANGVFNLTLTEAETAALTVAIAKYDIEIVWVDTSVSRLLQGNAVLSNEVTK